MRAPIRHIFAAACLVALQGWAAGQVQIVQQGQALDANPLVGSGGQNITRYTPGVDSQLYVYRQVTGLAGFRGSVSYFAPDQLNLTLPSAAMDTFRREAVGVNDVVAGSPYMTAPYYDRSSTALGVRGIVSGQAMPGTNIPMSSVPARPEGLLGQAGTITYTPLGQASWQGLGRSGPSFSSGGTAVTPFGGQSPLGGQAGASGLFAVPNAAQREQLARELQEVPLPENLRVDSEMGSRTGAESQEDRAAKLRPPEWTAEPNAEPNAQAGGTLPARRSMREAAEPAWQPGQDIFSDLVARVAEGAAAGELTPLAKQEGRREQQDAIAARRSLVERQETAQAEGQTSGQAGQEPPRSRPGFTEIDRRALLTPARGAAVEYTPQGELVIHSLAGQRRDEFNRLMTAAEGKLKEGKYYEAAEIYRVAIAADQENPLGRVGLAVAMFSAGEPLGAAYHLKRAATAFPPILSTHLDLAAMVDPEVLGRRLDFLAARMADPKTGPEPMLHFIAAYVHDNLGQHQQAREDAQKLAASAADDQLLAGYAQRILAAPTPTSAPASGPATAPASHE